MKNIIIGTAGHIDHGKTSLIKALTGRNTDRWKEEQKRGITIDLGFTYFDLPNGNRAGIIDVPGHEKFIHNMAAGVVGMDLVLLVIAADEGIMPQTREHMDILNLLGIEKSIVVLNKSDLVEEDWLELVEEEIREELSGTFLKDAPVVRVSSVTGQGLDELVAQIVRMTEEEVREKEIQTIARLPIDRIFTMAGFGTVVTGTLVSGRISREDTLQLYPQGQECKIRGIQVYGEEREECFAGQRVAVNISNVKKDQITRGCVLAPVNSMKKTTLLDVKLQMLDSSERILENRSRLHLFTGTSEVLCRAVLLDKEELAPGECGYVQLRLEEEIAVRRGDRFVVRFYSPMETIGGGVILEPNPRIKKRFRPEGIEELKRKEAGSSADVLELHIKAHNDTMITAAELARLTALSAEEVEEDLNSLQESGLVFTFPMKKDIFVWHVSGEMDAEHRLLRELKAYEERYPYRRGMKKAEIQGSLFKKMKPNVFDKVVGFLEETGKIKRTEEYLSTIDYSVCQDEVYTSVHSILISAMEKAGYDFIRFSEIPCEEVSPEVKEDIFDLIKEEGLVVKLGEDLYTLASYIEKAKESILKRLQESPVITIGEVRDMFETSRKSARLILDYTDNNKITRKAGAESERVAYSHH